MLLVGVVALVLAFRRSSNLAAAYGIAVTGTMIITTLFAYLVARYDWGWGRPGQPVFGTLLVLLDLAFSSPPTPSRSSMAAGSRWSSAASSYLLLTTWKTGRDLLQVRLDTQALPLQDFITGIETPISSRCRARRYS